MNQFLTPPSRPTPPRWTIVLAFALVYLSWGTTYYVIRAGVHTYHLPPALFGGGRVCLAGLLLLGYLRWRVESLWLPAREFCTVVFAGLLMFVGGNGFITFALDRVPSGVAAVLVATTPLWVALLESFWPRGERLALRGWLGLVAGLGGVLFLYMPKLQQPDDLFSDVGPLLVLASASSWSMGSVLIRYRPGSGGSHLTVAAYQMAFGGGGLVLVGLGMGEARELAAERITPGAIATFVYLLIVGSLVGFVAFNYLLGHVSAARVGTYAYVNPLIAILVGWVVGGEELTPWILGGMVVILLGVALVRGSGRHTLRASDVDPLNAARSQGVDAPRSPKPAYSP
jgi:drug/metabolite transporter (DMT)-like permease